jgi:DNA-binding GntR family transcriptional regulator
MTLKFQTKNQAVYEILRKGIIEGKFKPGQKIVMREVAKELGLSEIPVREAIRRLECDGLVIITPHLGAVVSKIDEHEFVETYLIRIELEPLATRLALPHITSEDIQFLIAKNSEMKRALQKNQYEKLGAINRDFHLRIYNAAPYPYLNQLIASLWERLERIQSVFAYVPERAKASVLEHERIIDALKDKDIERSENLIKEQKIRTISALEKFLKTNK